MRVNWIEEADRPAYRMHLVLTERTFVSIGHGLVYFRIFGRGLWVANYERYPPSFSERCQGETHQMGYIPKETLFRTKKWRVNILRKGG